MLLLDVEPKYTSKQNPFFHISSHFCLTVTLTDKIYLPYLFTVSVLMKIRPMGNGHEGIRKIGYFPTKRQIVDWRIKVRIFNEDMGFEMLYWKHRYYKMNMDTKPWRKHCFTWYKKWFFVTGINSSFIILPNYVGCLEGFCHEGGVGS